MFLVLWLGFLGISFGLVVWVGIVWGRGWLVGLVVGIKTFINTNKLILLKLKHKQKNSFSKTHKKAGKVYSIKHDSKIKHQLANKIIRGTFRIAL